MTWYIAPDGTPAPSMAHLNHQFTNEWSGWTVHTERMLSVLLEVQDSFSWTNSWYMSPFTVDDPPGSPFLVGYESDCRDYRCLMFGVRNETTRPNTMLLDGYREWTAGWDSKMSCKLSVRELFGSSLERLR